jgi:hypothetical protein
VAGDEQRQQRSQRREKALCGFKSYAHRAKIAEMAEQHTELTDRMQAMTEQHRELSDRMFWHKDCFNSTHIWPL